MGRLKITGTDLFGTLREVEVDTEILLYDACGKRTVIRPPSSPATRLRPQFGGAELTLTIDPEAL